MIQQWVLESLQDGDDGVNGKSEMTEKPFFVNMQKCLHIFLRQRENGNNILQQQQFLEVVW